MRPRRADALRQPPHRAPRAQAAQPQVIHIGAKRRAAAFGLSLLAAGLRGRAGLRNALSRGAARRAVLILEPFGLGDVISLEPLIRALRERQFDVRLCARAEWRALYPEPVQWVPAFVPWGTHNFASKYRPRDYTSPRFRECFRDLRAAATGAVGVDTRGDIRSVLFLYLAGCRRVITLSNYLGSDLRVPRSAATRVVFSDQLRRWELNLAFLPRIVGPPGPAGSPPFFPHLAAALSPPASRRVGLVPVAPWTGKLWSPGKWRDLAGRLRTVGWELNVLCGPGQAEAARGELGGDIPPTECGALSAWVEALRSCALLITLDTGPMHLADALGVPVVALFGQGILPLWAPSGPRSCVLTHRDADFLPCHPTDENVPRGRQLMDRIEVEEVVAAARRIMAEGGME